MKTSKLLLPIAAILLTANIGYHLFLITLSLTYLPVVVQGNLAECERGIIKKIYLMNLPMSANKELVYYFKCDSGKIIANDFFINLKQPLPQINKSVDSPLPVKVTESLYELDNQIGYLKIQTDTVLLFIWAFIIFKVVVATFYSMIIYYLYRFVKNSLEKQFFSWKNTRYLRNLAIWVLVSFVLQFFNDLINFYFIKSELARLSYDLIKFDFYTNWEYFFLALLVYVISLAFAEGVALKEEQSLTI